MLLAVTSQSSIVYSQSNGVDLAIVIDGSGSISGSDFTLQKEGIKRAIQSGSFPIDGSVNFSLIQFASTTTTVEIPYTRISNSNDITNIVNQINSISQIGGSTNPGDGILQANDVFNSNGKNSNEQIICLSTDGVPNAGASLSDALSTAKTSQVNLDTFTVIAIEDPGFFYADDFYTTYGPHVFGNGSVTVVQSSIEFANTIGGCITTAVELVGLEVVQTIQDWNNSIQPLVENKTTYVRAHVQTTDQSTTQAFARLHGTRNGTPLPGSPLTAVNAPITIGPNAIAVRDDINKSFYFQLPYSNKDSESWLNGTVDLQVEIVGSQIACKEAADTNNDCKVQATFAPVNQIEIEFVGINWAQGNTSHEVKPTDYAEMINRIEAIYPIAKGTEGLNWSISEINWSGTSPTSESVLQEVNQTLEYQRLLDLCFSLFGCERIYYGILVDTNWIAGLANNIPGTVATSSFSANTLLLGRNVPTHEIGHLFNRHHAVTGQVKTSPIFGDYKEGRCGSIADSSAPNFPYGYNNITPIGPMNGGQNTLIYGFDTHLAQSPNTNARQRAVISPYQHFELMSYCGFVNNQFQWISPFTYNGIKNYINSTFTANTMPLATQTITSASEPKDAPTQTAPTAVLSTCAPDSFGYTCIDSNEAGGPQFDWIDISSSGINLNMTDDSYAYPINLPFNFNFYGTDHSQVAVGSNGTVYFDNAYLGLSNSLIPSSPTYGIDSFIAVYWDDLNPTAGGEVLFDIQGTTPNQKLIVQWDDVPRYDTNDTITVQAILFETSNDILIQYLDPSSDQGAEATTGIQGNGSVGLQYGYDESNLSPNLAVCYDYPGANNDMCGDNDGLIEHLIVRGSIDFSNNTADFLPFGTVFSPVQLPTPSTGDTNVTLQLLDSGNNILNEVVFEPNRSGDFGSAVGTFIVPVVKHPALARVRILFENSAISDLVASPNAPTVEVVYPNGTENLAEETINIRWNASDADGDTLNYTVQYSQDNGASWKTLIVDWPNKSYEVDITLLAETTDGLIRVIASDGFNTGSDVSDTTFNTPNHAPQTFIISPIKNEQYIGTQNIFFEGRALDPEEGLLTNDHLVWRSNLDGLLGEGESFVLNASDLREGSHVITLRSTDSLGASSTTTINIEVLRLPVEPPTATDDALFLPIVRK